MRYIVERMTLADIPRVVEIENLSFSTPWPPSSYRKELQENRYAHYVVARDTAVEAPSSAPVEVSRRAFPLSLLPARQAGQPTAKLSSIVGFAGLWLMVDEAHITIIATHPESRGQGIGELLLGALIDIAYEIGARHVTLEVRVSNAVAQNLYRKYGFKEAGVRRRYYSDNNEDALIMWTEDIFSPTYRRLFAELKASLAARLASAESASGV